MSEKTRPASRADGWIQTAVGAFVIVITTFTTFSSTIHEYIDTKMEAQSKSLVRDVSAIGAGQMLLVMDSTVHVIGLYYDTTCTRLDNLEELVGVRPSNRTIITPPDTVALKQLKWRMQNMEQGIEAILDGMQDDRESWKRRTSHNTRPVH